MPGVSGAQRTLGSREVAYVLTGDEYGFTHDDVDEVEDVLVLARRDGLIPWEAISDGRTAAARPWTVAHPDELARQLLESVEDVQGDRQAGQRFCVEGWAEAMGWLPRLRRLLLTAEQVERYVGERGRSTPSVEARRAGWPYPFTAQAEALPPEVRDQVVADAIDALHDLTERERVIAAEAGLQAEARRLLRDKLADG